MYIDRNLTSHHSPHSQWVKNPESKPVPEYRPPEQRPPMDEGYDHLGSYSDNQRSPITHPDLGENNTHPVYHDPAQSRSVYKHRHDDDLVRNAGRRRTTELERENMGFVERMSDAASVGPSKSVRSLMPGGRYGHSDQWERLEEHWEGRTSGNSAVGGSSRDTDVRVPRDKGKRKDKVRVKEERYNRTAILGLPRGSRPAAGPSQYHGHDDQLEEDSQEDRHREARSTLATAGPSRISPVSDPMAGDGHDYKGKGKRDCAARGRRMAARGRIQHTTWAKLKSPRQPWNCWEFPMNQTTGWAR